jgi:helix-hairpin-helix protein
MTPQMKADIVALVALIRVRAEHAGIDGLSVEVICGELVAGGWTKEEALSFINNLVDLGLLSSNRGPVIIYGLSALKGVGEKQAAEIVRARNERQFTSLRDFAERVDLTIVGRKALECLANAGAFDCLEPDRATAFASIDAMLAIHRQKAEITKTGQGVLF